MSEKHLAVSSDLESNNNLDEKNFNHNPILAPIEIQIDYQAVPVAENTIKVQPVQVKASYKETFLTLIKGYIGSGILALPYSFYQGGLILSTILYIIIAGLINYQQVYLLKLAEDARKVDPNLGYAKLVQLSLGNRWGNVCQTFLAIMQWGCCISYVIFFLEFLEYAIYESKDSNLEHQLSYLGLAFCVLLPMTLITNMALFTKVNTISNILIALCLFVISVSALETAINHPKQQETIWVDFENITTTIGVGIFAFEAVGIILNVQNTMQKQEKYERVLQLVTGLVVVTSIFFSLICSIGFGADINQIVLFNLPESAISSFIQVCYAIAIILTFPLQLLPGFEIVEEVKIIKDYINRHQQSLAFRRTMIRIIQVVIIGFIALGIPQFAVFLSLLGGVAGSMLQFFFPLLLYYKKCYSQNQRGENIKYCSAMALGILLGAFATVNSFIKIVSN